MPLLDICKFEEVAIKTEGAIVSLWDLSFATVTTVLNKSVPKQCYIYNLIKTGQLVQEIFMFESVNARTDGRTDGRSLPIL